MTARAVLARAALAAVLALFLTGRVRAGLLDDLGTTFGFDGAIVGAAISVVLMLFVVLIMGAFEVSGPALIVVIVFVAIACVIVGLLPSWTVILIAIIAGGIAWRMIADTGGASA